MNAIIDSLRFHSPRALLYALLLCVMGVPAAFAQAWTSGSNGSDGALTLNASSPGVNNGVLDFDPVALNLDVDGDNIYHFTTINISSITLRIRSSKMRTQGPIVWLASGDVSLYNAAIDLSGATGHMSSANLSIRTPSEPGPGGYPGGVGAKVNGVAQAGYGPGGGHVANPPTYIGCPAGHAVAGRITGTFSACGPNAPGIYGTAAVQPLIGGSGGSGGAAPTTELFGPGGGAGGGAIRISSSTTITITNANIYAQGGAGGSYNGLLYGGAGSGGSIHLQAPTVSGNGNGTLYVTGGSQRDVNNNWAYGSQGRVRIDANSVVGVNASPDAPLTGPLVTVPLPVNPSIRITTVGGQAVPVYPQGSSVSPDVTVNTTLPVTINVAASNIPVGTPVTLIISTDQDGPEITSTVNLGGSQTNSTATTNVTLPQGVSIMFVRAVW